VTDLMVYAENLFFFRIQKKAFSGGNFDSAFTG